MSTTEQTYTPSDRFREQQQRRRMPVSLSTRIPLALYEDLQGRADELGVDLSVIVRQALELGAPRAHGVIADAIEQAQENGATP